LGMSRMDLAEILGVSPSRVSNWITGRNGPRGSMRERLAKALGVDSRWLMGDLDDNKHSKEISEGLESPDVCFVERPLPKKHMYNLFPGGGRFGFDEGDEDSDAEPTAEQIAFGELIKHLQTWLVEAEHNPTVCGYLTAQMRLQLCHRDLEKLTGSHQPN